MRMNMALLIVMFMVVEGVSGSQAVHAAPSIVLDGIGRNTSCGETVELQNCAAQLLTTTRGNDVIILVVQCYLCSLNNLSIIDKIGLTYVQRAYSPNVSYREYYARTSSPLTLDNITVVFPQSMTLKMIQVFAIKGASREIFDPILSSPLNVFCDSMFCSVSIETPIQDFIIASTILGDIPACDVPSGFTTIISTGYFEVDYLIASKNMGTVIFSCSNTEDPIESIVVDAISFHGPA